ncbi:hypothetical protein P43SY_000718 [Pythium insidiosum]|uniref:Uncharacterized protein n=1 Tax=Pythium insidiosum TaxID=114742 RepID=A0AAD5MB46_PYTIN|nr:hypothetical protein P43SY_000718 [Pythium insidiosum]
MNSSPSGQPDKPVAPPPPPPPLPPPPSRSSGGADAPPSSSSSSAAAAATTAASASSASASSSSAVATSTPSSSGSSSASSSTSSSNSSAGGYGKNASAPAFKAGGARAADGRDYARRHRRDHETADDEDMEEDMEVEDQERDEDDEEDEEEDEEVEHDESPAVSPGSSSRSSSGRQARGASSAHMDAASPVRRLPSVLRPPPGHASSSVSASYTNREGQSPQSLHGGAQHSAPTSQQSAPPQSQQSQYHSRDYDMHHSYSSTTSRQPIYPAVSTSYSPVSGANNSSADNASGNRLQSAPQQHHGSYYAHESMERYMAQLSAQQSQRDQASAVDNNARSGQKRRLNQPANESSSAPSQSATHHSSSNSSSSTFGGYGNGGTRNPAGNASGQGGVGGGAEDDDPLRFETRGSHGPRDEMRYETWTSKQLRKKCSHLKLRGLKNVKKHVMVEALYRYYRNQRQKDAADSSDGKGGAPSSSQLQTSAINSSNDQQSNVSSTTGNRYNEAYTQRYDHGPSGVGASFGSSSNSNGTTRARSSAGNPAAVSNSSGAALLSSRKVSSHSYSVSSRTSSAAGYGRTQGDEEAKMNSVDNEVRITSDDVMRLVDVILSPEFVDRLATELSRWQFWVDVREKYIALLSLNAGGAANGTASGDLLHRLPLSYSRNAKWSSMQLWEMWKELTFAYTKACFEFTAAGMTRASDRDYIQFCEGRPDVYYLHQRLHARPDLLHLIKSNEYIEEKLSDASDSIVSNDKSAAATALMGVASPSPRAHKRFKRIAPGATGNASGYAPSGTSGGTSAITAATVAAGGRPGSASAAVAEAANAGGMVGVQSGNSSGPVVGSNPKGSGHVPPAGAVVKPRTSSAANTQYRLTTTGVAVNGESPNGQEEGSTENSETTGEDGSIEKSNNSNSSSTSMDSARREALAEQKYFGLLLQNFEAIFESLHNKKVLLAALRKDSNAPDHLIADLHDDIHVLSALKKEFRTKLRQTLE